MNGISQNEDLSDLIDKVIIQICIGLHEIVINFDDDSYITLECLFSFNAKDWHDMKNIVSSCKQFVKLLGKKVICGEIVNDKTVMLRFECGEKLYFNDSNEYYESFQIKMPNKHIIV